MNKEFLIFLFFLALSSSFWLLMSLNETYEKEYCIPVTLTGVPNNTVMTGELSDTAHIVVRDKGFTLLTYSYGKKFRPLSFRFATYANTQKGKGYVPTADIQRQVLAQLYGSSKLVSMKVEHQDFFFNFGQSKRVAVKMTGKISTSQTYYLANTSISPNTVTIYAHKSLLDSISAIYTLPVNLANLRDTIHQQVELQQIRGRERGGAHHGGQHARGKDLENFSRQGERQVYRRCQGVPLHQARNVPGGGRLQRH